MKRVEDSSGARYSVQNEKPRKFEPITPVGTNYTPIGKVDINEINKTTTRPVAAAKPVSYEYNSYPTTPHRFFRYIHILLLFRWLLRSPPLRDQYSLRNLLFQPGGNLRRLHHLHHLEMSRRLLFPQHPDRL